MKRSRKIFTIVLSAILLCLITTTAIVAFAADNSVTVTTEQELIAALNDSAVNKVIVANDIEITEASSVEINGANKVMDGGNFKITFAKYFTFTANDFVQELKNIDFVSDSSVNLTLKYGGSVTNVDAAMMSISTNGTVNITDSHLKTVSATNASKNTFVSSSFQGLTFDKCSSITVDGVTIVGTGNNYGIRLDTWCSGTIKNTSISNCSHGISADMNGYNATLENVTIENCTYGIYNHGDVNGSTLYLNGVTIKDATKYGIYCTGTNSNGSVRIKADSTLTLDLNAIGIYLKKGSLTIEKDGAIAHTGDYYTVFQDVNSYVSDYAEILNVAKENGAGQYYNVTGKVGGDCYFSSVTVATEEELQAAIADETISNIELANNITITQSLSIKGMLKVFDGKGFALDLGDKTYSISAEEYVEFKDLKLQTTSTSTGYISLSNGSGFDNVEAPNYRISTSGTIIVDNSSFYGVSISSAPKSKVLNTTIGANGISIGSSETCSIENVTIQLGASGTGINLGNRSGTTIKNVTIIGGSYGICADMNGRTATLENVTIENCTYGIYNHGDVNGSTLNLNGVSIKNATKYGIYCTGTNSNGSVRVKANSTLTLDLDAIGVYLKKGSLTIEKDGDIAHTGDYYTVFQDVNSYVSDSAEILNVAKENGAGQYYNVTGKVGEDCYFSSVTVTTEEELQAAIADETISNIELANNITITQSLSIKGILKVFDGKGFALDFGDKTYSIYADEYVEFKNLKLQTTSTATGYISLSNGSNFENVEAPNYVISTSGTITIIDSSFYGVSISSAPKSKVLNTVIGAGGISIGSSEDHLIDNVTITNGTISLGNRSRGTIKNTTIDGGSIYAALNGQTVTLENVTIKNSARYGIEIYGGVNGSTIKLKDVTIQNTGSYAIYCKGSDSSASIYVLESSTLAMEVAGVAIQLETGYMRIQGNISHTGEGYAVVADPKSTCSDSNHQLVLIDDPTTNSKLYLFKGNYDDKVAPEMSLNGDSTIELVYGAQYIELGAVAVDNIDGELEVVITGEVNTSCEGEYTLIYTVIDYHGNTSTLERKIVVICNHDYDISIPLEPTCSAVGEKKFECTICGKIETETLPARGHYVSQGGKEMVDSYEIKNDTTYSFTVTDDWYASSNHLDNSTSVFEIRAIYDCTLVLKYKVSSEGNYDKLIILHNSTTKDTISGSVSEKTITLTLKAGDIVYVKYTKDSSQSSGTDTGSFKIESCTQTEIDTTVYVSTDDVDPTCTEAVICESCHQTMKAALGHTNSEAVVENRVEPDCTTDGNYDSVIYCSVCNAAISRDAKTIDKLGHDHSTEWTEDVAPTCTTVGSKSHHCSRCDDKADVTEVEALGHSFTDYKSNDDATYTEDGTETSKCDRCAVTDTRTGEDSALGLDQKFKDELEVMTKDTNTETTYSELYALLQTYATLSDEEKANVATEFAIVQQMIGAYNQKAQIANNELADATEIAFAPIVATGFTFLAALWFLLKKKFFI